MFNSTIPREPVGDYGVENLWCTAIAHAIDDLKRGLIAVVYRRQLWRRGIISRREIIHTGSQKILSSAIRFLFQPNFMLKAGCTNDELFNIIFGGSAEGFREELERELIRDFNGAETKLFQKALSEIREEV